MKRTTCVLQGLGIAGMVDFFTATRGLALEVTRDGRGIREHSARFLNDGRYTPLMEANIIREHAIIDLRSPSTRTARQAVPRVAHPHLYTVLFSGNFKEAEIYHMNSMKCIKVLGNAGQEARQFLMSHYSDAMPMSSDASE